MPGSRPTPDVSLPAQERLHVRPRCDRDRKGKIREFDPSAIAYDPSSKSFYILSADYLIVVVTPKGKLLEVVFLDPDMYRQPEGICFDAQGDLFLSSEGAGAKARLFRFSRN